MKENHSKKLKKGIATVLTIASALAICPAASAVEYDQMDFHEINIKVGGNKIKGTAVEANYPNNTYISLRSFAEAMNGTGKQFDLQFFSTQADGDYFQIDSGKRYQPVAVSLPESGEEALFLPLMTNRLFVDGQEKKYYTYRAGTPNDLYMSLTDIQLLFNLGAECSGTDEVTFYPDRTFAVSLTGLRDEGYFNQASSVLLGNAGTGEIYFATEPYIVCPIASTSKLMTYLLAADAAAEGKISWDDTVLISDQVEALSRSVDGRIRMTAGKAVPLTELIDAMLVISSNEAALAVAEHVCGTEEAFTEKMNAKARELKMTTAEFFNCSGLPVLTAKSIPTKKQNQMSIRDLFTLTREILNSYPEVTKITSQQLVRLETLDYASWNSNPDLFNNSSVNGLKTGSTIASGNCIVTSTTDGTVAIVLGADQTEVRGRMVEILLRSVPG